MTVSEIIVYIWLIPVVAQIVLPLGMFVSWLVLKPLVGLRKEKAAIQGVSLQES